MCGLCHSYPQEDENVVHEISVRHGRAVFELLLTQVLKEVTARVRGLFEVVLLNCSICSLCRLVSDIQARRKNSYLLNHVQRVVLPDPIDNSDQGWAAE